MSDIIIVNPLQTFLDLLALASFVGGYALKGVVLSIVQQLVFKPLAERIIARSEQWEQTHPNLLTWLKHFIENHSGHRPSTCDKCQS